MKTETKTSLEQVRWTGAASLLLLPLWVGAIACFFYYLVRTGWPMQ